MKAWIAGFLIELLRTLLQQGCLDDAMDVLYNMDGHGCLTRSNKGCKATTIIVHLN